MQRGLNSFRVHPIELYENKEAVKFDFVNRKEGGATDKGVFLSSNILTTDQQARNIYDACQNFVQGNFPDKATMSISPIAGEFLSFGPNETGRGKPKVSSLEAGLCLVSSTTRLKPCMAYKEVKKKKTERTNTAIMPDLPLTEMLKFVRLFKRMSLDLEWANVGRVFQEKDKKTGQVKKWVPLRPRRFDGNFPHAPRCSALGSIALLGAIGTWSKEAEYKSWGDEVLDSLKGAQIYLVSYGKAQAFRYSHYIVELAKEDRLTKIVDSI